MVCNNIAEAYGLTPLVRLNRIPEEEGITSEIYVKVEYFNPSGSLKDRILYRIIKEALESGRLKPGMTIIEATTGNTGIATAMMGAIFGYPVKILIPEGMSEERMKIMRMYGAELILTPGAESDVDITLRKLEEIVSQDPDKYFVVSQYDNPNNPLAHYYTTGPEIWEQMEGKLDALVQTQGTGGTVSGVARYLKEQDPSVKVYTAEPQEAPFLSKGQWGSHKIEGIGDGFIPPNLDLSLIDGVILTTSDEAIEMARKLARLEGILCGISSGHNVAAAVKLSKRYPEFKRIVTFINDNGLRYFSTPLFGIEKDVQIPEREHNIRLSDDQRKYLLNLEIIE
ncbi:MAG: cysteine synthase A [Synergistetes bacterium]|nr:cysteine synthase A [Synergistota bacterium]